MAYTTIQSSPESLDEEIATFAGTVTSIDAIHGIASQSRNEVVALIEYTA